MRSPEAAYMADVKKNNFLSRDEEIALGQQILSGGPEAELARQKFFNSHLHLVVKIAKEHGFMGVLHEDLVQEGNIGLMKAVEKFDPSRGVKFATHARWWIRASITRALFKQKDQVKGSMRVLQRLRDVGKARALLAQRLMDEPTREQIAAYLECDPAAIETAMISANSSIPLDAPVSEDDARNLKDFLADPNAEESTVRGLQAGIEQQIRIALKNSRLKGTEEKVIRQRFGLDDAPAMTLSEIGRMMDLCRERIRQIERDALRKLRESNPELKELLG